MLRDVAAIPAVLLINGHNPLTLLHDLLSDGIHELDDDECLARAREAEVILCEIANRMQIALTKRKTVNDALSSILNRKAGKDAVAKAIEPQRSWLLAHDVGDKSCALPHEPTALSDI